MIFLTTFKRQIFAESMLVNEMCNYAVPCGFIKFDKSGDFVKLNVSDADMESVRETIREINKTIETELMPSPTEFQKRCRDCCYLKICRRA